MIIDDQGKKYDSLSQPIGHDVIVIDTETTGLNYMTDYPFGCSVVSLSRPIKLYVTMPEHNEWLRASMFHSKRIIMQNAKFDLHMLLQAGVIQTDELYKLKIYDTFIAEALIDEHLKSYKLDSLAKKYDVPGKLFNIKDLIKEGKTLLDLTTEDIAKYAIQDAVATAEIFKRQNLNGLKNITQLEFKVIKTLVELERTGIRIDIQNIEKIKVNQKIYVDQLQSKLEKMIGFELNVSSNKQMQEAWKRLKLPERTSFTKDFLKIHPHPFCKVVLNLRSARKLYETFMVSVPEKNINGRIYTNFNQMRGDDYGTKTGRLSSSGPNMQQIPNPKRADDSDKRKACKIIRSLFIPDNERHNWISADWEQFEFRIFAHFADDEEIKYRYQQNPKLDYHQVVSDLTGVSRWKAKQINLGLIFGMGNTALAKELNLPTIQTPVGERAGAEAMVLFNQYHRNLPSSKALLKRASGVARNRGYIKSLLGRYIRFPDRSKVYKAGGLLFQSSAADLMKKKLVELNREAKNYGAKMNLTVHDEFNFSCPKETTNDFKRKIKIIMENIPELTIPILADVGSGKNWHKAGS